MREIIDGAESRSPAAEAASGLVELGLTVNEANAYVFLLQNSPATGYKVAKGTSRSFSNTYQILEALRKLGAVLVEEGGRRLYRALPIDEFLAALKQRLESRGRHAARVVRKLSVSGADQRLWEISNVDQVYETFRRLLAESRERVLSELFPEPLEILRDALEATAARGIIVVVRIYQPSRLDGVRTVLSPYGNRNLRAWQSQWMSLYTDGLQYLQANLMNGGRGVHHAVWSRNSYVSRTLYSYLNSDLHHYSFRRVLDDVDSVDAMRKAYTELQQIFPPGGDLGFQRLFDQTVQPAPEERDDHDDSHHDD